MVAFQTSLSPALDQDISFLCHHQDFKWFTPVSSLPKSHHPWYQQSLSCSRLRHVKVYSIKATVHEVRYRRNPDPRYCRYQSWLSWMEYQQVNRSLTCINTALCLGQSWCKACLQVMLQEIQADHVNLLPTERSMQASGQRSKISMLPCRGLVWCTGFWLVCGCGIEPSDDADDCDCQPFSWVPPHAEAERNCPSTGCCAKPWSYVS